MQPAAEAQNSLSLERKLKLHEARESIIGRLASNLPRSINLDSFLQVIVAELGQMMRSEEHTSELQSQSNLVCRLLLEKKKLSRGNAPLGEDLDRCGTY